MDAIVSKTGDGGQPARVVSGDSAEENPIDVDGEATDDTETRRQLETMISTLQRIAGGL